jgi:hypothetical protein
MKKLKKMVLMTRVDLVKMLIDARKEGFDCSGEGYNAEYPYDFETEEEWGRVCWGNRRWALETIKEFTETH